MDFMDITDDNINYKYLKYSDKILRSVRDDISGGYGTYTQHLTNTKIIKLKRIYGINGDLTNTNVCFLLNFPTTNYYNITTSTLSSFNQIIKNFDSTAIISTFNTNNQKQVETNINIYFVISWDINDTNALTKANSLINHLSTIISSIASNLTSPLNNVQIDNSVIPLSIISNALPTINYITTTYTSSSNSTAITVYTIGLYDHIAIKTDNQDDSCYIRLRNVNQRSTTLSNINPSINIIIVTLFSPSYTQLYQYIQLPSTYLQQTQGANGDVYNTVLNSYLTLNMTSSSFTIANQNDFILTMNNATKGYTTLLGITSGSTIINYNVIFDVTTSVTSINNVVTQLSNPSSVQNIISNSSTLSTVTAIPTPNKPIVVNTNAITTQPVILSVSYNGITQIITFKTIGTYNKIAYQIPSATSFLTTTSKSISAPSGISTHINAKLEDVNGNDLTTVITFFIDTLPPTITLIGNSIIYLKIGNLPFTDPGVVVTDLSGETITPIITGSVNVNTLGTYVITYTATDISNNTSTATRTIKVINPPTITLNGNNPYYIAIRSTYIEPNATAVDYFGTTVTVTYTPTTVNTTNLTSIIITYTATDTFGFTTIATRTVNVINPPTITLNGNASISILQGSTYTEQSVTITDISGLTIVPVITGSVNINVVGTYVLTYTATNIYNISSSITRTIIVTSSGIYKNVGYALFSGSSGSGIDLINNTGSVTITGPTLTVSKYMTPSGFIFVFAGRLWNTVGRNDGNMVLLNTSSTGTNGSNLQYSFGTERPSNWTDMRFDNIRGGIRYNYENNPLYFMFILNTSNNTIYLTASGTKSFSQGGQTFSTSNYGAGTLNQCNIGSNFITGALTDIVISNANMVWTDAFPNNTITFAGSNSFNSSNNTYIDLLNNTGTITMTETNINPNLYMNTLGFIFTFSAMVNLNTIDNGRFLRVGGNISGETIFYIRSNCLVINNSNDFYNSNCSLTTGINTYIMFKVNNFTKQYYFATSTNIINPQQQQTYTYPNLWTVEPRNIFFQLGASGNQSLNGSMTNITISDQDLNWADVYPSGNTKYFSGYNNFCKYDSIDLLNNIGTIVMTTPVINPSVYLNTTSYIYTFAAQLNINSLTANSSNIYVIHTLSSSNSDIITFGINNNGYLFINYNGNINTANSTYLNNINRSYYVIFKIYYSTNQCYFSQSYSINGSYQQETQTLTASIPYLSRNRLFQIGGGVNTFIGSITNITISDQDLPYYLIFPQYNTPPTISLNGNNPIFVAINGTYTELGATANGNGESFPTLSTTTSGTVNTSVNGSYTITYTATDSYGVSSTANRIVIVDTVNTIRRVGSTLFDTTHWIGIGNGAPIVMPEGSISLAAYMIPTNYIYTFAAMINITTIPDTNKQVIHNIGGALPNIYQLCLLSGSNMLVATNPSGTNTSTCPINLNTNTYIVFKVYNNSNTCYFATSTNINTPQYQCTQTINGSWVQSTSGFGAQFGCSSTAFSGIDGMTGSIVNIVLSDQDLPWNIIFPQM